MFEPPSIQIAELPGLMRKAGVPERLIPRLVQLESDKRALKTWRKDQGQQIDSKEKREAVQAKKNKRADNFAFWLFFLTIILEDSKKQQDCSVWMRESIFKMCGRSKPYINFTPHTSISLDQAGIERNLCGIGLLTSPAEQVVEAANNGWPFSRREAVAQQFNLPMPSPTGRYPMSSASQIIEEYAEKKKKAPAPETAPAAVDKDEVEDFEFDLQGSVASPSF